MKLVSTKKLPPNIDTTVDVDVPETIGEVIESTIKLPTKNSQVKFHWKTMDSAPTDGTEFLATGANYGDIKKGRHYVNVKFCNERGGFVDLSIDNSNILTALTHWTEIQSPEFEEEIKSHQSVINKAETLRRMSDKELADTLQSYMDTYKKGMKKYSKMKIEKY